MFRFLGQLSICLLFFNTLSLVWYSVSLNYYKNQLFFPKTFACHIEAKREIKKYLNPFCLSTLVKQFYSALQAFSALEEVNAAKPHLKMQMIL